MASENPIIPSDAVRAIQESVATSVIIVDGTNYVTRQVFAPPKEPTPSTLNLNTLTGLVDYVNKGTDALKAEGVGLMVQVVNEQRVDVVSSLFGRAVQRKTFASANAEAVLSSSDFQYGVFYDCETFVIKLQSLFEDFDGRKNVLKVVGNIKEEDVRQANDDGVTQTVTARSGIARVAEVEVPNPVWLAPFRTFREVTQPLSPFVLRMKKSSDGSLPKVALFEADGGKWKLDAIKFIKDYLTEHINEVPIIA